MSRITEALERARLNGDPVPGAVARKISNNKHSGFELPPEAPAIEENPPLVVDPGPDEQRVVLPEGFGPLHDKLVIHPDVAPMAKDQYRKVAVALRRLFVERGAKTVMVASAVPGEGKTLTASNLALTLSVSYGQRVVLIDADLRHPGVHAVFGIPAEPGLSQVLAVEYKGVLPTRHVTGGLSVMTAGPPMHDPIKALSSERMRLLLADVAKRFDWVIIDTPPTVMLPDAQLIRDSVDAVILVVQAGSSSYSVVQRAVEALGADRIAGVVLNQVVGADLNASYGYYSRKLEDAYYLRRE